jgi:flagellar hook protein FlgE
LQATAEVNPGGGWNLDDPVGTSNFSTAISVYDSLGVAHTVLAYFQRTSQAGTGGATTSDWTVHLVADGADITGGTAGQAVEVGSGTLSFDVNGELTGSPLISSPFNFSGGPQQNQTIGFNFTGSSQVGTGASVTNSLAQDGFGAGNLEAIDITTDGIIVGKFSNGLARNLAQFTLATFPAESELFRAGDNLFSQTPESGQALLGVANAGINGSVLANTLELSNVDITHEFVNMITTQRVYQANTKVITTADEMLESVIQIKR